MAYTMEPVMEAGNIRVFKVTCGQAVAYGASTYIPDEDACMHQISCEHGLLLCRIYDIRVIDRDKTVAALFAAPVAEDLLRTRPVTLSEGALEKGATYDMTGAQLVELFSE